MSKWTKLQKTPSLFFKDMLVNFITKNKLPAKMQNSLLLESLINKETTQQEIKNKKESPQQVNMQSFNYNRFYPYTHLLHTGENASGLSHLDLWIPHFQEANIQFVICVRNYELFTLVQKKYPYLTLLFAKTKQELSIYFDQLSHLKACFYPSNTGNNLHLLQYNHLTHIFIGHGDSDKTASAHKYFRVYDENWVAGDAHIDRFKNAGFDFSGLKNVKVGRPNLKEILKISQHHWRDRFNGKLNLLYLSTWEGVYEEQNYTSAYMINDAFNDIATHIDQINIKLHPWIGRRDKKLIHISEDIAHNLEQKNIQFELFEKEVHINSLIKNANIFICDISAVITDSLAANGPIFVYIPKDKEIKLSKSNMSYEDYTYTFSTIEELLSHMHEVLNGNDYLEAKREEAMQYILGKDETLHNQFIKTLNGIKG